MRQTIMLQHREGFRRIGWTLFFFFVFFAYPLSANPCHFFKYHQVAMGTVIEITLIGNDEEAANNLERLIFVDPSANRGLSFEWPSQWLAGFGVNEYNPVRLFKIAFHWKNSFIHLCRLFDKVTLK